MEKTERQSIGANKWRDNKGKGLVVQPTGFGKTIGTIRQIVVPMLQKAPYKILILVHRTKLLEQWKSRLDAEISPKFRGMVRVETVQWYITNNAIDAVDLLVVDEIHKFYSEDYIEYINGNKIKFKFNLGLTATPYDKYKRWKLLETIYPIVDEITQEEAIREGWVSNFIEFNVPVALTDEEIELYKEAVETVVAGESKFDCQGKLAIDRATKVLYGGENNEGVRVTGIAWATMWAKYKGWNAELAKDDPINQLWNPHKIIGYAKMIFTGYRDRDAILNHCKSKYEATIALLRKFKDLKAMCFSESTVFADDLKDKYRRQYQDDKMVVYHSQLPSTYMKDSLGNWITYKTGKKAGERKLFGNTTIKEAVMSQFLSNEARILSTARILDEGFDCEDIRLGIITSRTSNYNQQTQRGGRIKRIIPTTPKDVMMIVNLYVANTEDERRLNQAQSQYTHRVIPVQSVENVNFDAIGDDEISNNDL
jgi:superfamily II DNA or RNA helicase